MSKKVKIENFHKIPLDCFCHVITFLDSPKDYFSLILVVKGLFEYTGQIFPHCTQNLKFKIFEIPAIDKPYISNVDFEYVEGNFNNWEIGRPLRRESCIGFPEICHDVFRKFSNLQHFSINTTRDTSREHDHLFWTNSTGHKNLRNLKIQYPQKLTNEIVINPPFLPKLETLNIVPVTGRRLRGSYKTVRFESKSFENLVCLNSLTIKHCNLPVLNPFPLCIRKRVKKLLLSDVSTLLQISNFENLSELKLEGKTPYFLTKLERCENLKTLDVEIGFQVDTESSERKIKFCVQNFPNLERLKFHASDDCPLQNGKKYLLHSLPKLREVEFNSDSSGHDLFEPVISSLSLEVLRVFFWKVELDSSVISMLKMNELFFNGRKIQSNVRNHLLFSPCERMNIKSSLVEMSEFMTPDILLSLSLEEFKTSIESKKSLCIDGLENLKLLSLSTSNYVEKISKCPNLKTVNIFMKPELILCDDSIQNIESFGIGVHSEENFHQTFSSCMKIINRCPKITTFRLHCCLLSEIALNGDEIKKSSTLEKFIINFKNERVEKIHLENFWTVKKVEMTHDEDFVTDLSLKNIPRIELLELNTDGTVRRDRRGDSCLFLENLLSLKEIQVGVGFSSVRKVEIRNCLNVSVLRVCIGELRGEDRNEPKKGLVLDGDQFPNIERIDVDDVSDLDLSVEYQRISLLKNLCRLKKIEVLEGERFNVDLLVERVEGSMVDLNRIEIVSDFFFVRKNLKNGNYHLGHKKMSLKEYFLKHKKET